MTFSRTVKSEILRSVRNIKTCCATSFLTAVIKSSGSLTLERNGYSFSLESDNMELLQTVSALARERLQVESKIVAYNMSAKGTSVYSCKFDSALGEKLGLVCHDDEGIVFCHASTLIPRENCCRRAFMQGLFVSCGSVVVPQTEELSDVVKAKYHLELRFTDNEFASAIKEIYPFDFKQTPRKNHLVLYLKDSERIADFLVYVNATQAKFELENVIIERSLRNSANRQSNCMFANIDRTVAASAKQMENIEAIRRNGLFETLPEPLKEIALVREENPEATLEEIADKLHISKSGANHRFAKLAELAEKGTQ